MTPALFFTRRFVQTAALALLLAPAQQATAQDAAVKNAPATKQGEAGNRATPAVPVPLARQLPADVSTQHSLELPGRTLKFKATAGSIPLMSDDGKLLAEMGYVSYQLDGADPLKRPVAFAFNGGPGSASAWVHIGGFGPWRLPLDGAALSPSAPPVLIPNAETWLDFTDLVFIDPIGTGYSRLAKAPEAAAGAAAQSAPSGGGEGNRNQGGTRYFYSVNGDAESVADMMAKWLAKHARTLSPKIIVGESYGGIRAPKAAHILQSSKGVGVSAIMLVSPVMDYGTFRGPRHRTHTFINTLPTIAAAAREAKGQAFKARVEQTEVEAYARGAYLTDLMRGPRDVAALDRIITKVAGFAGLPENVVRQYGGRLDEFIYIREANRAAQRQASGYDASVTGDDPDGTAYFPRWEDPFAGALSAPVTGAMQTLYAKLEWKTDIEYHLASGEAFRAWQYGNTTNSVESVTQLQAALALDPKLRLLVTHGATDLRTPYFGSVLLLEQLPAYADRPRDRVQLKLYPGGHMHYSREASRKALRDDTKALVDQLAVDRAKVE
jgi:carboxypeptidase C (cathepsin A)